MKSIAILFAVFFIGALALTDEQKAKLKEYRDSCVAETGVDSAVVDNAKNGNIAENDEKLKCFASCLLKKIGILNASGNFDEGVARAKAPPEVPKENIDDIINKCKDVTGANDCEKGGNLMKCFVENKQFIVLN